MVKIIKLFTSEVINVFNESYSFLVPTIVVECFTVVLANIKMVPYNLFTPDTDVFFLQHCPGYRWSQACSKANRVP